MVRQRGLCDLKLGKEITRTELACTGDQPDYADPRRFGQYRKDLGYFVIRRSNCHSFLLCDELILKCFLELAEISACDDLCIVFEENALVASYEHCHGNTELAKEQELIILCFFG